ncbi:DUF3857 domain-containing transglutaminase family protein [Thalassotalea sp. LPB0316]|uniref:DUF3857 domain-containing transglutaminase family protein n=1 Tax=Thalassotalea sp. LPB0316 TaxID=2769490 RepID=UPI0018662681|nr:DUF3857 domain-containing transglutaminase family protein [Thalassotalea sp. LPB0316]QOL26580.1 DUF3857 domain-containing transglutaminase family protein [Thalassotalea sp. LPB0316]
MKTVTFKTLLLLVFFYIPTFLVAADIPDVKFAKTESWISDTKPHDVPQSVNDASVNYLLFDNQVDIRTSIKKQFFRYSSQPISEQGLQHVSQIEVIFAPQYETLTFHTIDIVRNGKLINKIDKSKLKVFQQEEQLKENIYSENWVALFILEDVRVGDIINYSYTITGSNPVLGKKSFGYSPLNWGVPVALTQFRLVTNANELTEVNVHNSSKKIVEKRAGDFSEYSLIQRNVAAVTEDDYMPAWYTPYAYVTYSQYRGWEDVNDWAMELYDTSLTLPKELIRLIESSKTSNTLQTATLMTQWVQDNIRYFGIEMGVNSHLPSSPSETFNRRFGDCKDKAVLLIAVLKQLNIDAYPVLVSTTTSKNLPNETPSPGAFNHVIVTFEIDEKSYWVDATVSNQRGSLEQMSFPDYYWGLVVKDNTSRLTSIEPHDNNQLRSSINVTKKLILDDDSGRNQLIVETEYSGWQAELVRNYIDGVGINILTKDQLNYFSKYFPKIETAKPIVVKEHESLNKLTTTESYYILKLANQSSQNQNIFVYAHQILDNIWLPNTRNRSAPFILPYYLDINMDIQIIVPAAKNILWYEDVEITNNDNKWFTYERRIEKRENSIFVNYGYRSLLPEVSASEFHEYASLLEGIESSLTYPLLLRQNLSESDKTTRAKNLVKMLMKNQ